MANFKKMLQPLNFVKIIVLLILVLIIYNIYSNSYEQQIAKIRKDKDHYFRTSINSPILEKEKFEGLNYYAPDKKFKVVATLKTFTSLEEISITNSDGRKTQYVKYANATFLLNEKTYTLILYKSALANPSDKTLFLPFSDMTNGEETYQGGRYLDINSQNQGSVEIDFNLAYHPFCLYNYKFSCPLPPSQNFLNTYIKAGEKLIDSAKY